MTNAPLPSSRADIRRAPFPIFGKVFTDSWRSLIGWGVGLAAVIFLYLPIYPSIGGSSQMQDLINSLPEQLTKSIGYDQISTGSGYTESTMFGLLGFLLMTIAAVSWGASALGGDEESGQLELTLAHGVTRVQVALERFAALAVKVLALTALVFVLVLALNGPSELELDPLKLLGTCLLFGGLTLLSGTVALLFGALFGRRVWGVGAGAFVAVVGYIFNAIGNQSSDLAWLHSFSPYSWVFGNTPLTNGANWGTAIGFYLAILALGGLTALVLRKRDVGV
ncbi:MAG: ABC transporter permease [Renibacterium salmoninarum]|nr:ABC transporter permease [Renibacterium salmoninarum]